MGGNDDAFSAHGASQALPPSLPELAVCVKRTHLSPAGRQVPPLSACCFEKRKVTLSAPVP